MLILNLPKTSLTEVMLHQKRSKTTGLPLTLDVSGDNGEIVEVKDAQYTQILGANIQNNMVWNAHMEMGKKSLLPQCRKLLGHLRHNSDLILRRSRRNICNGLLLSKMTYLMPLWGSSADIYIQRAQIILNTAARWITGLGHETRIRSLMTAVNWLTMKEQILMSTLIQTWKTVHLGIPPRLLERMSVTEDLLILIDGPRLQFSTHCYHWQAADSRNNLGIKLRQIRSISMFRKQIRIHILSQRSRGDIEPD